jgi:hypothetical protein
MKNMASDGQEPDPFLSAMVLAEGNIEAFMAMLDLVERLGPDQGQTCLDSLARAGLRGGRIYAILRMTNNDPALLPSVLLAADHNVGGLSNELLLAAIDNAAAGRPHRLNWSRIQAAAKVEARRVLDEL